MAERNHNEDPGRRQIREDHHESPIEPIAKRTGPGCNEHRSPELGEHERSHPCTRPSTTGEDDCNPGNRGRPRSRHGNRPRRRKARDVAPEGLLRPTSTTIRPEGGDSHCSTIRERREKSDATRRRDFSVTAYSRLRDAASTRIDRVREGSWGCRPRRSTRLSLPCQSSDIGDGQDDEGRREDDCGGAP
jgi:hypothetical protein